MGRGRTEMHTALTGLSVDGRIILKWILKR
jgi:hypothetical protein